MNTYYVYQYIREDLTPYYIGKGKGKRAWAKHSIPLPKDKNRIVVIADNLTEEQAHSLEIELIAKYGRKDLGTGILHNRTNGGEGSSGYKHTETAISKISKNSKDRKHNLQTRKIIGESNCGSKNGMYGKTHSDEAKNKMRLSKTGKKRTKETCNKISILMKGKKRGPYKKKISGEAGHIDSNFFPE